MERDFDLNPYSPEEARVAKYLMEKTGIGGGGDPIGFILASHNALAERAEALFERLNDLEVRIGKLESQR